MKKTVKIFVGFILIPYITLWFITLFIPYFFYLPMYNIFKLVDKKGTKQSFRKPDKYLTKILTYLFKF